MTNKDYDAALEALAELVKDVSKIVHAEAVDKALVEPTICFSYRQDAIRFFNKVRKQPFFKDAEISV